MPKVPGMRPPSRIASSAVTRSTSSTTEKKHKDKKHSKHSTEDQSEDDNEVHDYRDAYRQRLPWEIDPAPGAKPTWEEEEEKRLKVC